MARELKKAASVSMWRTAFERSKLEAYSRAFKGYLQKSCGKDELNRLRDPGLSACAPLNLGKTGLQLCEGLVRSLPAAPGFLAMVQFVDAAENADDRVLGNVPCFSRTRFGVCIGGGIDPAVVLRGLAAGSSTKHYTVQRSHNTATTSNCTLRLPARMRCLRTRAELLHRKNGGAPALACAPTGFYFTEIM